MSSDSDFGTLLLAAMCDAATEGKCTQLQATITPPGQRTAKLVRIIVVAEEMDYVRAAPGEPFQRPT